MINKNKKQIGGNKTFKIYTTGMAGIDLREWNKVLRRCLELIPSIYTNIDIIHFDPFAVIRNGSYIIPKYTINDPPDMKLIIRLNDLVSNETKLQRVISSHTRNKLPIEKINNKSDCIVFDYAHIFIITGISTVKLWNYNVENNTELNIPVIYFDDHEEIFEFILNYDDVPLFSINNGKIFTYIDNLYLKNVPVDSLYPLEIFRETIPNTIKRTISEKILDFIKNKVKNINNQNIKKNFRNKIFKETNNNWLVQNFKKKTQISFSSFQLFIYGNNNIDDIITFLRDEFWEEIKKKLNKIKI
jgi:hypothetical protein